jgi:hypothetical protein
MRSFAVNILFICIVLFSLSCGDPQAMDTAQTIDFKDTSTTALIEQNDGASDLLARARIQFDNQNYEAAEELARQAYTKATDQGLITEINKFRNSLRNQLYGEEGTDENVSETIPTDSDETPITSLTGSIPTETVDKPTTAESGTVTFPKPIESSQPRSQDITPTYNKPTPTEVSTPTRTQRREVRRSTPRRNSAPARAQTVQSPEPEISNDTEPKSEPTVIASSEKDNEDIVIDLITTDMELTDILSTQPNQENEKPVNQEAMVLDKQDGPKILVKDTFLAGKQIPYTKDKKATKGTFLIFTTIESNKIGIPASQTNPKREKAPGTMFLTNVDRTDSTPPPSDESNLAEHNPSEAYQEGRISSTSGETNPEQPRLLRQDGNTPIYDIQGGPGDPPVLSLVFPKFQPLEKQMVIQVFQELGEYIWYDGTHFTGIHVAEGDETSSTNPADSLGIDLTPTGATVGGQSDNRSPQGGTPTGDESTRIAMGDSDTTNSEASGTDRNQTDANMPGDTSDRTTEGTHDSTTGTETSEGSNTMQPGDSNQTSSDGNIHPSVQTDRTTSDRTNTGSNQTRTPLTPTTNGGDSTRTGNTSLSGTTNRTADRSGTSDSTSDRDRNQSPSTGTSDSDFGSDRTQPGRTPSTGTGSNTSGSNRTGSSANNTRIASTNTDQPGSSPSQPGDRTTNERTQTGATSTRTNGTTNENNRDANLQRTNELLDDLARQTEADRQDLERQLEHVTAEIEAEQNSPNPDPNRLAELLRQQQELERQIRELEQRLAQLREQKRQLDELIRRERAGEDTSEALAQIASATAEMDSTTDSSARTGGSVGTGSPEGNNIGTPTTTNQTGSADNQTNRTTSTGNQTSTPEDQVEGTSITGNQTGRTGETNDDSSTNRTAAGDRIAPESGDRVSEGGSRQTTTSRQGTQDQGTRSTSRTGSTTNQGERTERTQPQETRPGRQLTPRTPGTSILGSGETPESAQEFEAQLTQDLLNLLRSLGNLDIESFELHTLEERYKEGEDFDVPEL